MGFISYEFSFDIVKFLHFMSSYLFALLYSLDATPKAKFLSLSYGKYKTKKSSPPNSKRCSGDFIAKNKFYFSGNLDFGF